MKTYFTHDNRHLNGKNQNILVQIGKIYLYIFVPEISIVGLKCGMWFKPFYLTDGVLIWDHYFNNTFVTIADNKIQHTKRHWGMYPDSDVINCR